ncbi:MAG: branched-chain amino acid ABC transporter permease [Desulfarculaceae bacterium]|nr:branched-chain amino acid ABC transporter permease [Desulfarculaceae bacterium]MCF8073035.1 branched-chain amino acid ABC transporter permease [Desulfarculaceae bacterium]MCF8101880.1 branched-chain amino acid ABC transporter permease [Desulfarculaceae bacterium]MCF8115407.1 branched-chain amino acid ABC transporter permease [Desulfarculaceae bacterium]
MLGQLITSGIAIGATYALMALAMVIIYKTSEVLNFAQGDMAMLSAFVAYMLLSDYGLGFTAAFTGALAFAFALGAFLEFAFLRRAKEPNLLGLIIITLGLEMMLYGIASWRWGADQKDFPFPVSDFEVHDLGGGVVISDLNLVTLGVACALMILLFLFFRYTKVGVAMKATQQNQQAARLMGIRVGRIMMLTWGMSALVGACAAFLIASTDTLDPNLMWTPQLKGFSAAVLGGMTSLVGAVLGGFILGVVENLFGGYVSVEFKSVVAFAVIVLILCVKPSGLFAKHYVRKV